MFKVDQMFPWVCPAALLTTYMSAVTFALRLSWFVNSELSYGSSDGARSSEPTAQSCWLCIWSRVRCKFCGLIFITPPSTARDNHQGLMTLLLVFTTVASQSLFDCNDKIKTIKAEIPKFKKSYDLCSELREKWTQDEDNFIPFTGYMYVCM